VRQEIVDPDHDFEVRAAGGLVVGRDDGGPRVAVIHRPKYGDWTLPKGKLEPDEHPLHAALREVREETGLTCTPQVRLPTIRYLTGQPDVEKQVEYWSMRVRVGAGREPDDEVAEVRWVPLPDAARQLTYRHDRGVLAAFARLPRVTAEATLIRHARAGTRGAWHETDQLRPLDSVGHAEVARLTPLLAALGPDRLVSATPQRCRETLLSLAEETGLPVKVDAAFDEDAAEGVPGAAAALLALGGEGGTTVVCSQGKVIPPLLRHLRPAGTGSAEDFHTVKGTGWLLAIGDERGEAASPARISRIVAADRLLP
jgi:8-oxo-(d)GTP phosphatase